MKSLPLAALALTLVTPLALPASSDSSGKSRWQQRSDGTNVEISTD